MSYLESRTHSEGISFSLGGANNGGERDLLQLRVADFLLHALGRIVHLASDALRHKFSKVTALVYFLYKVIVWRTCENLYLGPHPFGYFFAIGSHFVIDWKQP